MLQMDLQIEEQEKKLHQEQNNCERNLQRINQLMLLKQQKRRTDGYKLLIQFAKEKGASRAENWIKTCLSEEKAGLLYDAICYNSQETERLIRLIPSRQKYYVAQTLAEMKATCNAATGIHDTDISSIIRNNYKVKDHEALKLAREKIHRQKYVDQMKFEEKIAKFN